MRGGWSSCADPGLSGLCRHGTGAWKTAGYSGHRSGLCDRFHGRAFALFRVVPFQDLLSGTGATDQKLDGWRIYFLGSNKSYYRGVSQQRKDEEI